MRTLLLVFVVLLVMSGVTAVPLRWEVDLLQALMGEGTWMERFFAPMAHWISFVHLGVTECSQKYPFLFYGNDWLAYAHVTIAIAFWGPLRDPIRNLWVIEFGMIACLLVIPTAMIFGPLRGIPFFWRCIDCSFGVFGILPLWLCRRDIKRLIMLEEQARPCRGATKTVSSV